MVPDEVDIKKEVIEDICIVLKSHLGDSGAKMYREYYQKIDLALVIKSASEMLEEILGPKVAQRKINSIKSKYNIES